MTCQDCERMRAAMRSAQRDYANVIAILQQLLAVLPADHPLAVKLREAHERMVAPASPPAKEERDESKPPPGWGIVCGELARISTLIEGMCFREDYNYTLAEAWAGYDKEHGYAPAARPVPELPPGWSIDDGRDPRVVVALTGPGEWEPGVELWDDGDVVVSDDEGDCAKVHISVLRYLLARADAEVK